MLEDVDGLTVLQDQPTRRSVGRPYVFRGPNRAVPTRTIVAPSSIAIR